MKTRESSVYAPLTDLFAGNERFRVMGLLGAGSMGVVFEAFDRDLECRVALKLLPTLGAEAVVRFKHEFRSLHGIHHPNLVSLGELIDDGRHLFFTMELVAGVDLLAHVGGGAGEARLRSAFAQLTQALMVLHGHSKVHRDVKPSNVLVAHDGRVVLLDFGLLVDVGREGRPQTGRASGTVLYMSPEQASGLPVEASSDYYSVGVLLYEALTGRAPFIGYASEVLEGKCSADPVPPSTLVPGLPADLERLCLRLLDREPGARPDGSEILAVLRGQDAGPARPPQTTPAAPPFVGRRGELARLDEALASVAGGPEALVIEGESGVGKTALVRAFVERIDGAAGRPVLVLRGRCCERESMPFKAFDGVAEELAEQLARAEAGGDLRLRPGGPLAAAAAAAALAFPVFGRWAPPPSRGQDAVPSDPLFRRSVAFQGVRDLLMALSRQARVVLAIDDWQWVDADSIALLSFVLAPPAAPALLLLLLDRTAGRENLLPCPLRRLALGNLGAPDAEALARQLLDRPGARAAPAAAGAAGEIAFESMGHPLFIAELVRHAVDGGPPGPAPPRLEDAIWSRYAALDPAARRAVDLLAVARSPVALSVLCAAMAHGRSPLSWAEVLGMMDELTRDNLARSEGLRASDTVDCFHDRVAVAVLARLPLEERRLCHQSLAAGLERTGSSDFESLAHHWQGAGDGAAAATYAVRAADGAMAALAFERASQLYRLHLSLAPTGGDTAAVQERLGEALGHIGRGREAADAYLAAGAAAPVDRQLELSRRAADQLFRSGYVDEAVALMGRVFGPLGLALPRSPRRALLGLALRRAQIRLRGTGFRRRQGDDVSPRALARVDATWTVSVGLSTSDNLAGSYIQSRHLLLALELGEPLRVVRALAAEAGYRAVPGLRASRQVDRLLEGADRLARELDEPYAVGFIHLARCFAHYLRGDFAGARGAGAAAEAVFEERPVMASWELTSARMLGLAAHFYSADLGTIARRVPEIVREAEERGDLYTATCLRLSICNCAWLVGDDGAAARRNLELADRSWTHQGVHLQHAWSLLGWCQLHLYEGDPGAAHERVLRTWPLLKRSFLLQIAQLRMELCWARARVALALAGREPQRAPQLLREAERYARRLASEAPAWAQAAGALTLAGVLARRGDAEGSRRQIARAATLADSCGLHIITRTIDHAAGQGDAFGDDVRNPARWAGTIAPGLA